MNKKIKILKTNAFTFLEIFIVMLILGLLFALVAKLSLKNYQSVHDSNRMKDLKTLETALKFVTLENPDIKLSSSTNIIYLSLKDNSPTCTSYISNLPPLPQGYEYRCSPNPENIDGTGWIPIDFTKFNLVNISVLPIDPVNQPPYYYAYVADNNTQKYEVIANLESNNNKGPNTISDNDGGTSPYLYEVGSDKSLIAANFENSFSPTPPSQLNPGTLIWATTSNPSSYHDAIYDATQDSDSVYIAGFDNVNNDYEWRIEKRSKTDGSLIWVATSNPSSLRDWAHAITVDSQYVYIGGFSATTTPTSSSVWRIEKRNKDNGSLIWTIEEDYGICYGCDDRVNSIVKDNSENVIYVGGRQAITRSEFLWRLEKRETNTGTLLWVATSNPSTGKDEIRDITFDTDFLYITGVDRTSGKFYWRVEKRQKNDGALVWATGTYSFHPSSTENYPNKILTYGNFIYIIGNESIGSDYIERCEKRSKDNGGLLAVATTNPSTGVDYPKGAAIDSTGIYIVGYQSTPGYPDTSWRIEKRSLEDCSLVWATTSDYSDGSSNDSNGDDYARAVLVDPTGIYIFGYDSPPGDSGRWGIEKRAK